MIILSDVLPATPAAGFFVTAGLSAFWLAVGAWGAVFFYTWGKTGVNPAKPVAQAVAKVFRRAEPEDEKAEPSRPRMGI